MLQIGQLMLCSEWGFPVGSVVESPPANARDAVSIPWSEQTPWSRKWQSTPVFLPENVYGQRNLAGNSPWNHKELDMTEQLSMQTHMLRILIQYFTQNALVAQNCQFNSSCKCKKKGNFLTNLSDNLEDPQEISASHHSFEIGLSLFLILGLIPQETDLDQKEGSFLHNNACEGERNTGLLRGEIVMHLQQPQPISQRAPREEPFRIPH